MISGFQSISTINSGLILAELEQDVTASNLAQPSLDSQGYLMNSLESVNAGTGPSLSFDGLTGVVSVGAGVSIDSITRLRSSFLDSQIRQQSMLVGYNEILANTSGGGVLNQVNSIINTTASDTLNSALTQFQNAWLNLGNGTGSASQVLSAGTAFAQMANSQYNALQNLQLTYNDNIQGTVGQINQLLLQLSSINSQLNATQGSNQNSLLDARDYALDRLSRLVNFQVTFGSNGTSSVFLNGVSLLSSAGAGQLQAFLPDPTNPALADISVSAPTYGNPMQTGGNPAVANLSPTTVDITSMITGGNLGGELQARNVVLQSYKQEINQIATGVMNVTNSIYATGYNGVATGQLFFEGTGASNIIINGALTPSGNLAISSVSSNPALYVPPVAPPPDTEIAQLLGGAGNSPGLMNLLSQNYAVSLKPINQAGAVINPFIPMAGQLFQTNPVGGGAGWGTIQINGVTIQSQTDPIAGHSYNAATDSIADLVQDINSQVSGVTAVYDSTNQRFYIFSSSPVKIIASASAGSPTFFQWANVTDVMVGLSTLNNSFDPNMPKVYTTAGSPLPTTPSPMDSLVPSPVALLNQPTFGPNISALAVTAGANGTFSINGMAPLAWNNTQSVNAVLTAINGSGAGVAAQASVNTQTVLPTFFGGNNAQAVILSSLSPISIADVTGNFTSVIGVNTSLSLGNMSSSVLGQVQNDLTGQTALSQEDQDALNQLNTAQANLAGINTGGASSSSSASGIPNSSNSGVPIASIQQQATSAATAYNALLEIMQVIDNMYQNLINVVGGGTATSNSNNSFQG